MDKKKREKKLSKELILISVGALVLISVLAIAGIRYLIPRVDYVVIEERVDLPISDESDDNVQELDIELNEEKKLTCTVKGTNVKNKKVEWTSSDQSIVMVDNKGKITGVQAGRAEVTCEASNIIDSIFIVVHDTNYTSDAATDDYVIDDASTSIIEKLEYVFVHESESKTIRVLKNKKLVKGVKYSIDNSKVATIDTSGKITGNNPGKGYLTANIEGKIKKIQVVTLPRQKKNVNHIHALDIVSGLAVVFESSDGHLGIYDTGNDKLKNVYCKRIVNYLNALGAKEKGIDFVVLSHMHPDHVSCFDTIVNNFKVKDLYIKDYSKSSVMNGDLSFAKKALDKYKRLTDEIATPKSVNIKRVSGNTNTSFKLGDMNFQLFNTDEVFTKYKLYCKPHKSKEKGKTKKRDSCNDNSNSMSMVMSIEGYERTSWNYFAADIENNGAKPEATYLKNNKGEKIKFMYGYNSQTTTYSKKLKDKNVKYIEDITACEVNYYIKHNGVKLSNNKECENSANAKRNIIINNNTINDKDAASIDLYQVSHHGFNNSLNVYSYIKPKYAVFAAGKWKNLLAKKGKNQAGYYDVYWPAYAGVKQLNMTGEGTVIYTIGKSGKTYSPIQLNRVIDAGSLSESKLGKAKIYYEKQ